MANLNDPKPLSKEDLDKWKRAIRLFPPSDQKWRSIYLLLVVTYAVIIFPLYSIGQESQAIRHITTWVWKATVFGVLSDKSPYYCISLGDLCYVYSLDQPYWLYQMNGVAAAELFIGGLISVRLLTLLLQLFEGVMGINLLDAAVQKWLGGKRGSYKSD